MLISIANLAINVVLNFVFIYLWGVNGLAFATSLSAIITFIVRLFAARKYVILDHKSILLTAVKVLIAAAVACFVPRIIFWLYPINRYLLLILSAVLGIGLYLIAVKLLKITEINDLIRFVKRKLKKT